MGNAEYMGSDCLSDPQKNSSITSGFQLFIVGSKQFFRSFYPFLLYLTFSILKIEILSARVGTNKYQACKLLIRYLLEVNRQSARSLKEEAKHLLNARNPLKKNGNTR